ncbi:RHS repeat-associated core domain-containing protein, partial [Pseudidiomarina atlantica]|uniref:RHS repeat-associated core domain-containing protein n=1 Tax=Pseudidiomarina atlantica TaxID=1517416 RepID=UPI00244DF02D
GRFYSNDPVGFKASNPMLFNRYAYANNNPYKYVDPDGAEPIPFSRAELADTRALASGQISRGQFASRAASRSVAAGIALRGSPAGRALSIARMVIGAVFNESGDAIEGILDGTTEGEKTKGRTRNFDKLGGMDQANSDFDDVVDPDTVETITDGKGGKGRRGTVNDGSGRKLNVRPNSSDGRPTVEIQDGKNKTKIRYN